MTLPRIAINGFGRIGRAIGRIAARDTDRAFEWVAVNDLTPADELAYLTRYDSVHGRFELDTQAQDGRITVGPCSVVHTAERDPSALPWRELGVDIVVECTGRFRRREDALKHVAAGAQRVLISAPGRGAGPDLTAVAGINDDALLPSHQVVSAASCTTTCLAPVARALHEAFGIETGMMTTVHSYTNDQAILDTLHDKDRRRGRTAAANMIPTTTGAATAIGLVLRELAGKLTGMAVRVPTPDVSLVDLVVRTSQDVSVEAINAALRSAADRWPAGTLRVEDDDVVSSDLLGDPTGSVVDAALSDVAGPRMAKVVAWYDNEWGYASRLYALLGKMARQVGAGEAGP